MNQRSLAGPGTPKNQGEPGGEGKSYRRVLFLGQLDAVDGQLVRQFGPGQIWRTQDIGQTGCGGLLTAPVVSCVQALALQVEQALVKQKSKVLPEGGVGEPAVIALADLEKSFGRRIGIAIERDVLHSTKNIHPSFIL